MNVIRILHNAKSNFILLLLITFLMILMVTQSVFTNVVFSQTDRLNALAAWRKRFVIDGSLDDLVRQSPEKSEIVSDSKIGIVMVVTNDTSIENYNIAIDSVRCYARIQNYKFILAVDSDSKCGHKDKFFRRHCVVAKILPSFDTLLFLDADIGVVNPKRRIEEFLSPDIDITFYDRFYNWEIMAGSYIVRNTDYAIRLLNAFADYEQQLPNSFHGTDNGAIHIFLADHLLPDAKHDIELCREVYNKSKDFKDLFSYEACIRAILGSPTDFGKVRIMRKGTGWARDDWLTSGQWSDKLDFMLHGWKTNQLLPTPNDLKGPQRMGWSQWYNPLAGPIHLDKCNPSNSTWSYNPRLLGLKSEIQKSLNDYERIVAANKFEAIGRIPRILSR